MRSAQAVSGLARGAPAKRSRPGASLSLPRVSRLPGPPVSWPRSVSPASARMTVAAETGPPVNPSPISRIRFLITKRIEDLEAVALRSEARQAYAVDRRDQLRDRLEEAEVAWSHVLKNFERFAVGGIDTPVRLVSLTRADLASLEERT